MKKIILLSVIGILLLALCGFGLYKYLHYQKFINNTNICQDDILIIKLIDNNVNPFSKFKYIKKRNDDCKILLYENKVSAAKYQKDEYCPYLESTLNSLTLLINTYVHEMYDRENASKALKTTTPLMTPYDYCPEYMDDMIILINIKKRLGL